jgi:vacuolar-type H+-ATPase subunit E/Vma4
MGKDRRIFRVPEERRGTDLQLAILEELILIRRELRIMNEQIQQAFDDLNEKVTNIESQEQAASTLLQGLNEQLQSALNSSNDPTEVVSNIRAISDRLNSDAQTLAAAITANTPASAPAPADTPPSDTPPSDTPPSGDATDPTA